MRKRDEWIYGWMDVISWLISSIHPCERRKRLGLVWGGGYGSGSACHVAFSFGGLPHNLSEGYFIGADF